MIRHSSCRPKDNCLALKLLRCFSGQIEAPPLPSFKANDRKCNDPTAYRIPLQTEDESTMINSTRASQWTFGLRTNAPNWVERSYRNNLKLKTEVQNIQGFNFDRFNKLEKDVLRQFSEFSDYMPSYKLSNLHFRSSTSHKKVRKNINVSSAGIANLDAITGRGKGHIYNTGRSYGPPRKLKDDGRISTEYDTRFNSKILQWDYRSQYFSKGLQSGFRTTVAVGNGKGLMGVGMSFHPRVYDALFEAKQYAYMQLVHFPMTETGSIAHSTQGRFHKTELHAIPISPYAENKSQWAVKCLLDLVGYKGVAVKLFGRNSAESICKAFFVTFQNFESYQQQSDKLGRYVVKFDPKTYFTPQILAAPKTNSHPIPYSAEIHETSQ